MSISRKISSLLFGTLAAGIALVSVVHFTDACRLKKVTYNGISVDNWTERFGLKEHKEIFNQPLDSLAQALLAKDNIFRVDIKYRLPHEVNITTNRFRPAGFVLDSQSGKLFGLDRFARIIPLENADIDWEQPVFTGVRTGKLFTFCKDERVAVVVHELRKLHDERIDLYRLLDEIDFSHRDYLSVIVAGLPFELRVRADRLNDDLDRFVDFIQKYDPDLSAVTRLDLRFDDMIICARGDS